MNGNYKPLADKSLNERLDMNFALKAARLGVWELDPITDQVSWDERCQELFGLKKNNPLSYQQTLQYIHPEDRVRIDEAVKWSMNPQSEGGYDVICRTLGADNDLQRWVRFIGQAYFNDAGHAYRFTGIAQDVTKEVESQQPLKASESRFRSLIEEAPIATCLFVGREMVIEVANKPMLAFWGKGNSVMGKPLAQAVPELVGQPFLQILADVFTTGKPYYALADKCDLVVDGKLGTYYFNFTYKPLFDDQGQVYAVMDMAVDVTEEVLARKQLEESEFYSRNIIENSPIAKIILSGDAMTISRVNGKMLDLLDRDASIVGKTFTDALPEFADTRLPALLRKVYKTGKTHHEPEGKYELAGNEKSSIKYLNFTFKALRNTAGEIYGVINTVLDVTDQVLARKKVEASEAQLKSVIASAPAAMGLFVGRDLLVTMPNKAFIDIVGKGPDIEGKPLREVMPELHNQPFLQILDDVFTTGKTFRSFGSQVNIVRDGVMTHNFYNITYSPLFNADGNVYAILDIAIDVTERVEAQQQIEESRLQLLALFEQSPVAIAIIRDPDLTFQMANPVYGELVGRAPEDIVGKPLLEAIPEIAGQGFDQLLRDVIATGVPYIAKEVAVDVVRYNQLDTIYVDLTYQPQREADGTISGILAVVVDVTQQVLSRRNIEEAEASLRGAIELAELATWTVNLITGEITNSARMKEWVGIDDVVLSATPAYIPEDEYDRVREAMQQAMQPEGNGLFDVEHTMINIRTGRRRIIHAQAKTYFDAQGKPYKMVGTAQDITEQRQIQLALEQQVLERTEQLASINKELVYANEEYAAINEELGEANQLLNRSNENLQQFAYIASHDLQEPLRKVQSFGDMLKNQYKDQLGEGVLYLERMQAAAGRMSTLIKDLLSFSRISTQRNASEPVSLAKVVQTVVSDLELVVDETGATIELDDLPTIEGDRLQLEQLFQNLLSNALKFRRTDQAGISVEPVIQVRAKTSGASELPVAVKPTRTAKFYYQIDVIDNGIGFDEKYLDRIFQVFQRLHGKNQYAGTGIGLAICEKVVTNHGGAITASSKPGQGATFSIYLPV
ncbi:PAS domain-containing protein [Spirosoma sp. RP8]|uniref:histidine kinase n=1 Tax=Spirosoma liriopis TaxID=2937440 RepID=A0ABT0HS00_9BACT|nr:PAS domain-containing protein [Spirosoma liriopis]MCK8494958.1 PAS domain-containing protein [Spirosoma liriopis]